MEKYDPNQTPKKRPLSLQLDVSAFEKATEEEKKQQDVMSESTTFLKDGLKRLRRNKLSMFGIIVLILVLLSITVAPSDRAVRL